MNAIRHIRRAAVGTAVRPLAEPFLRGPRRPPGAERAEAVIEGAGGPSLASLAPDPRLWEDWWKREGAVGDAVVPSGDGARGSGDDRAR